jgi:hypothetical protein
MSFRHARWSCPLLLAMSGVALTFSARALADTAIETETAQIGARGEMNISNAIEGEKASDGKALGTLTQFEYGITDRCEILIEPFFQQWEFPDGEPSTHGRGDLEITPSYEVVREVGGRPALLLAMKLKVPTGSKPDFSTGEYDYFPYIILGKHMGDWTMNANLGVDFITKSVVDGDVIEPGHDQIVWDLEFEREVAHDTTMFMEAYSAEEGIITGSMAVEHQFTRHFNLFLAAAYDEDGTYLVRTGFNIPIKNAHRKG